MNNADGETASQHCSTHAVMRVLGIDPGSRVTGFGIVEANAGVLKYVDSGCIRTAQGSMPARLKTIHDAIDRVIGCYSPQAVAIEKVFMARNPDSALILGHARGSAICAVTKHELPVIEYSALQVKQAVVGRGRAAKQQVQHMVRALLGLAVTPPADAADALACAICHLHTAPVTQKVGAATRDQTNGVALGTRRR